MITGVLQPVGLVLDMVRTPSHELVIVDMTGYNF